MINLRLTALLLASACSCQAFAQTAPAPSEKRVPFPHYADKNRGWFWKESIPEPEPEPVELPPPPAPPPAPQPAASAPVALKPMSSAWIKEKLPQYLDNAIDDPTPENISAYLYLQKYAMDASERFASAYQRVTLADANLDGTVTRPTWNAGGFAYDGAAEKATTATLKGLAQEYGLWFFFRSDCEACHVEVSALQAFATHYGFTVYPISIDGKNMEFSPFKEFKADRGQARLLGVEYTPSIYLVKPPNTFLQLSSGLVSATELETRALELGAQTGLITPEKYQRTRADRKNLLPSPGRIAYSADAPTDDPNFIRDSLKKMLKQP